MFGFNVGPCVGRAVVKSHANLCVIPGIITRGANLNASVSGWVPVGLLGLGAGCGACPCKIVRVPSVAVAGARVGCILGVQALGAKANTMP